MTAALILLGVLALLFAYGFAQVGGSTPSIIVGLVSAVLALGCLGGAGACFLAAAVML